MGSEEDVKADSDSVVLDGIRQLLTRNWHGGKHFIGSPAG